MENRKWDKKGKKKEGEGGGRVAPPPANKAIDKANNELRRNS